MILVLNLLELAYRSSVDKMSVCQYLLVMLVILLSKQSLLVNARQNYIEFAF